MEFKMRNLWSLLLVALATGVISEKRLVTTADDLYLEGRTSGDVPIDDEDNQDDGSGSGSGDYNFSEEALSRFHNVSKTTLSKEMVPVQPQSTAHSPRNQPTTVGESQDQTTTVKTPPYKSPDSNNREMEVPGDRFTETTSPSLTKMPFSETSGTAFGMDISVTKESDEANSVDRWDVLIPKDSGNKVLSKEFENEILSEDGRGKRLYELDSPEEVTSENMWERTEVLAAVIACGVVGFLCAVFLLVLLTYRMKKKDEGSYDLGDTKHSTTAYHKAPSKEFYA
ncbi:syndecan-2-like [Anabas testudineus]|uniref:syndecan-2-like n=1 Tax=Anabas testudineus TaxID=64144 RepID=UPI000E456B58|nr:syndecan-2-like [Anabas testudineus]